jgi:hypothetical protein
MGESTREDEIRKMEAKKRIRLAMTKLLLPNSFCIYNGTYIKLVRKIPKNLPISLFLIEISVFLV